MESVEERSRIYARLARARRLAEVSKLERELKAKYGELPEEAKKFLVLTKVRLLGERRGIRSITEDRMRIQLVASSYPPDYDAKRLRELPFAVEVTRYPPGFAIEKPELRGTPVLEAVLRVLEAL